MIVQPSTENGEDVKKTKDMARCELRRESAKI